MFHVLLRCAAAVLLLVALPTAYAQAQTPPDQAQTPVAAAEAKLPTDPAGARQALEALRADPANPHFALAGPALVEAYILEKNLDAARALSTQLLAVTDAEPEVEVGSVSSAMQLMAATNDWSTVDVIAPRAYAASALEAPLAKRVRTLHRLMVIYTRTARFDDALKTVNDVIALAGETPSAARSDALRALGGIQAMKGNFPEAIEALRQAEQVNTALGKPDDIGILRNLGAIFVQLKEWPRAIEYISRAERVPFDPKAQGAVATRMGLLSLLAAAHIGAGDAEPALAWSQRALDFGKEYNLPTAAVLNNLATLYRDQGDYAKALAALEKVKTQLSPSDAPNTRGVVEKNIGETLIALGQRERAATHLQAARTLYETSDVRVSRLELYPILIDNLDALGRPAEALVAMREFKALSDETITTDSQARIGELESTIDLERKTQELAQAEASAELQRAANSTLLAERKRAQAVNLGLAGLLATMVAGLLLSWRYQRGRARSLRELALRNQEIESQRSALQDLNAIISQQSSEDALTGLGNRRRLNEIMASPADSRSSAAHLLIMADLDHFKQINDQHGHAVGDMALQHFADALREVARANDVTVRWGGEEFIWLCREASPAKGSALCERLLRQLRENPLLVDGQPVAISASLGFVPVPVWPGTGDDWETALRIADHAVYCAKAEGRGTWVGYVAGAAPVLAESLSVALMEERGHLLRRSGRSGGQTLADAPVSSAGTA